TLAYRSEGLRKEVHQEARVHSGAEHSNASFERRGIKLGSHLRIRLPRVGELFTGRYHGESQLQRRNRERKKSLENRYRRNQTDIRFADLHRTRQVRVDVNRVGARAENFTNRFSR